MGRCAGVWGEWFGGIVWCGGWDGCLQLVGVVGVFVGGGCDV